MLFFEIFPNINSRAHKRREDSFVDSFAKNVPMILDEQTTFSKSS